MGQNIGTQLFTNCTSLKEINFPVSLTNIGERSFENCSSLSSLDLSKNINLKTINGSAFNNCDGLTQAILPNSVTSVGNYCFYDCDGLTKAVIPDSVTSIGSYVFQSCDKLKDVSLGTGLKTIPQYAFADCPAIVDFVVPYNVTKIENYAFKNDTSLVGITIPRNTTSIGSSEVFSYPGCMTIYGIAGTYAQTYANDNYINFVNRAVPATKITLNKSTLTLNRYATDKLVYTVTPSNFTDVVSWKSSNTGVATIAEDGTVKGVAGGTATITVAAGNVSASTRVTVVQPVTSISMSNTSASLSVGETLQLTATANPSTANNKKVTWSSSDTSVATVSATGLVRAIKNGSAKITATAADGSNVTGNCNITVSGGVNIVNDVTKLQSSHPYSNNFNETWQYTLSGASGISVKFSDDTKTESNYDYIYIFDGNGNQIGRYSGTQLAGQTISVPGNTVRIKLTSDYSNTYYGFRVLSVMKGSGSSNNPSGNNANNSSSNNNQPNNNSSNNKPSGGVTDQQKVQINSFVSRMYTVAMGREAEEAGLNDWSNQLISGKSDGATLARGFICSQEFKNKGLSNEAYLNTLYHTFFNREPDVGGMTGWMNALSAGESRESVLAGFVNSVEFANLCDNYGIARGTMEADGSNTYNKGVRDFVLRNYTETLGRPGETAGVEDWSHRINKGEMTPKDVAESFLHSQEFINKGLNDEEYIKVLYRTFLGREYDEGGLKYWMGEISTRGRDGIISGFSDSQEFRNIMAKYGL